MVSLGKASLTPSSKMSQLSMCSIGQLTSSHVDDSPSVAFPAIANYLANGLLHGKGLHLFFFDQGWFG